MSRLMSVAYTEDAVVERRKTVTRRKGWVFLKPGDRLTLCRKVQGRRRSDGSVEPLVRLAEVEVVSVIREPLGRLLEETPEGMPTSYALAEVTREGFGWMRPEDFVDRYFIQAQGIYPDQDITRIEWRYLDHDDTALAYQYDHARGYDQPRHVRAAEAREQAQRAPVVQRRLTTIPETHEQAATRRLETEVTHAIKPAVQQAMADAFTDLDEEAP